MNLRNFFIALLFFINVWAFADDADKKPKISYTGTAIAIELPNLIGFSETSKANVWQDEKRFIKLTFEDGQRNIQDTVNAIRDNISTSANHVLHDTATNQSAGSGSFLHSYTMVAGTTFYQVTRIIGDADTSAVISITYPKMYEEEVNAIAAQMLEAAKWRRSQSYDPFANLPFRISSWKGFTLTKKLANAVVFRSTENSSVLSDAVVTVSSLRRQGIAGNYKQISKQILESDALIENLNILHSDQDKVQSFDSVLMIAQGNLVNSDNLEFDMVMRTVFSGQKQLVIQITSKRGLHSQAKLQGAMQSWLSMLSFE